MIVGEGSCQDTDPEDSMVLKECTCHAWDYLGLKLDHPRPSDPVSESDITIGLIDSYRVVEDPYQEGSADDEFMEVLGRIPKVVRHIGECEKTHEEIRLSDHGLFNASVIAGTLSDGNYFNVSNGMVRGGISCELCIYIIGCPCDEHQTAGKLAQAIREATKDKVDLISVSLGYDPERTVETDEVGHAALDAFDQNILVCFAAGNYGPIPQSIYFSHPWSLTVGNCTIGKQLQTMIEVKSEDGIHLIQGSSCSVAISSFRPLQLDDAIHELRGEECKVFYVRNSQSFVMSRSTANDWPNRGPVIDMQPTAYIGKKESEALCDLINSYGLDKLQLRLQASQLVEDNRGPRVVESSSRGPSSVYRDLLTPDIVAPGYCVVGRVTKNMEASTDGFRMSTGTSVSCPIAAASIALMKCKHRD